MKPEQFIREYGVEKAREVVASIPVPQVNFYSLDKNTFLELPEEYDPSAYLNANYKVYVSVKDLKRLVGSLDIINDLGGIEKLTPYFITTDKHLGYTHVRMGGNNRLCFLDDFCDFIPDGSISTKLVMTAIRDHESIYGGGDE